MVYTMGGMDGLIVLGDEREHEKDKNAELQSKHKNGMRLWDMSRWLFRKTMEMVYWRCWSNIALGQVLVENDIQNSASVCYGSFRRQQYLSW